MFITQKIVVVEGTSIYVTGRSCDVNVSTFLPILKDVFSWREE